MRVRLATPAGDVLLSYLPPVLAGCIDAPGRGNLPGILDFDGPYRPNYAYYGMPAPHRYYQLSEP